MQTLKLYWGILIDSLVSLPRLFALYHLTVKEVRDEGEDIKTFIFTSSRPLRYQAGQYGVWFLPRLIKGKPARLFTVAAPPEEGVVQLSTRIGPRDFKQKLAQLKPGDRAYIIGPIGRFTLPKQTDRPIIFVAGGIGVTAVRALAKRIHDSKLPFSTTLIHVANGYYLYQPELEQYIDTTHFITRDEFETELQKVATEQPEAIYFVSGPPPFVDSARAKLKQLGITRIKTDGFLGYKR